MISTAMPSSACRSLSSFRICAWMVTSSAVVGSSAMSSAGRQTSAMAITARWSAARRSEEHTYELQSLMRISYAVLCLKKKRNTHDMKPDAYARHEMNPSKDHKQNADK